MLRIFIFLCWLMPLAAQTAPFSDNAASAKSSFFAGHDEDAFLPPDEAFKLSVSAQDAQTLRADFKIAPGHYLYRERVKFEIKTPATSSVSSTELPKGEIKQDPNFGQTEVWHQSFNATIKLAHAAAIPAKISLLATYQGCSEKGLCYAPIKKTFEIGLPASTMAPVSTATSTTPPTAFVNGTSEGDQVQSLLKGGMLWLIAVGFFGFGLLLSFTPCVFPMIPILSGIIVGREHPSKMHAFNLSVVYVMGMALSYTLAGIAAGLSGHLLSNALQNAWVLGASALIFVLLALSMFGFYELKLPSNFEDRMVGASNRLKGGRFVGVFIMGALSALIVSPCVAAPLAGALIYIGQTHDVLLGGVALFALSMGMGVPLLLVGASAGALLPKAGPWMSAVRNFFGVLMLGVAVWLIAPLIPVGVQLALWATLLIVSAIYLRALDSLPHEKSGWAKLWKGVGIITLVCGIALLVGALSGSKNPLQPLAGLQGNASAQQVAKLPFQRVKNLAEFETALKAAQGKPVMLDFYADWCVSCKEYEQFTFSDPRVQKQLQNAVLLQADVTQNSAEDAALLARFGLFGPPGILFFDKQGHEITPLKVVGYQDADKFLVSLNGLYSAQEGECAPTLVC